MALFIVNFKGLKMKHIEIWFGNMTHGAFDIGRDNNPMVIVNSIEEKEYNIFILYS